MTARWLILSVSILVLAQGCSSLLVKSTPAPVYYRLDYAPVTIECTHGFSEGVRLLNLVTSSPYNQTGMVVIENGQKVKYSSDYQWVSSPGALVADTLLRDFSRGTLFPEAVAATNLQRPSLELSGHIFTFAWEKTDEGYRARLSVEISLTETADNRGVILRKSYQLDSRPYRQNTADKFAEAMNAVMAEFSRKLQEDLCEKAKGLGGTGDGSARHSIGPYFGIGAHHFPYLSNTIFPSAEYPATSMYSNRWNQYSGAERRGAG
jgi:ABC-type uncharacterized transport system auxiliary subunit